MPTHISAQETTFYEELQKSKGLDLRDIRGMVHDLSFVLLGLTIALLRRRDGNLSSIHRSMGNKHKELCNALGVEIEGVVSRSHLPRILKKVCLGVFEELLFRYYKVELSDRERSWFAGDGKELRGSIEKGDRRGEVLVQLVRHEDRAVLGQSHYSGKKESEKPCLRQLLEDTGANSQKVTADALHLCPKTTEPVNRAGGIFLIGLKGNQKSLLQDMVDHREAFRPLREKTTVDKGHGRLEKRYYQQYDVSGEYFEGRWEGSGFKSLFKVERSRIDLKTNEQSIETAYYISNGDAGEEHGYFNAIREHWAVEVSNHVRDVSLKEDHLRTKKKTVTKVVAGLRTLTAQLLRLWKPDNIVAEMEAFQDDFDLLIKKLKKINFL